MEERTVPTSQDSMDGVQKKSTTLKTSRIPLMTSLGDTMKATMAWMTDIRFSDSFSRLVVVTCVLCACAHSW